MESYPERNATDDDSMANYLRLLDNYILNACKRIESVYRSENQIVEEIESSSSSLPPATVTPIITATTISIPTLTQVPNLNSDVFKKLETVNNHKHDSYKYSNSLLSSQQETHEVIDEYSDNQQYIPSDFSKYTSDIKSHHNGTIVYDSSYSNYFEPSKDERNVENEIEICHDSHNCDSETVEIGLKCRKLHLKKKEQKQLMVNLDKKNEHEFEIKNLGNVTAAHHLSKSCVYTNYF